LKQALEDCERVVGKILKEKKEREPDLEPEGQTEEGMASEHLEEETGEEEFSPSAISEGAMMMAAGSFPVLDSESQERAIWVSALKTLKAGGIKKAVGQLLAASSAAPSVRERHRYRLLMAKLCLKASRPDLARPIVEELYASINELNLERWESPLWIAEVLDALYQCLTSGEPTDDDMQRARELFRKLCTLDATKAMTYRG
jgi:type VI secretion system protein ImpA